MAKRARLTAPVACAILVAVDGQRRDFHELSSSNVDELLKAADHYKYRKPKNANGSRSRYFFARLQRMCK